MHLMQPAVNVWLPARKYNYVLEYASSSLANIPYIGKAGGSIYRIYQYTIYISKANNNNSLQLWHS